MLAVVCTELCPPEAQFYFARSIWVVLIYCTIYEVVCAVCLQLRYPTLQQCVCAVCAVCLIQHTEKGLFSYCCACGV